MISLLKDEATQDSAKNFNSRIVKLASEGLCIEIGLFLDKFLSLPLFGLAVDPDEFTATIAPTMTPSPRFMLSVPFPP